MKYLNALLARKSAQARPTELTESPIGETYAPERIADRTDRSPIDSQDVPSVSLVSAPAASVEPRIDPPTLVTGERRDQWSRDDARSPCIPPYPWRAGLAGWSVPWREAWGRHSNHLEEVEGLCWWKAEQRAFTSVSRLKAKGVIRPGATSDTILARLVDIEGETSQ
jgi:hypothetical protein